MFAPAVADTPTRALGMNSIEANGRDSVCASHDEFRVGYGACITTVDELQRLGAEWNELSHRSNAGSADLGFDSICERWKQQPSGQLAIIAVRTAGGRLVGVAPFYVVRSSNDGVRRLSFLAENTDHLKIVADARFEEAVIQEIARVLAYHRHEWDCIDLSLPGLMPLLDYVNAMTSPVTEPVAVAK
jgi:CelD/BcsL family acetyltransferase involved in cellulose biosynthesis